MAMVTLVVVVLILAVCHREWKAKATTPWGAVELEAR